MSIAGSKIDFVIVHTYPDSTSEADLLGKPQALVPGMMTVYSGSSQMCLDAYGKGTANGTKVDVWPCNGQTNQQ
jgi:hypothetical protein